MTNENLTPDWFSPPTNTIMATLTQKGITASELADRIGWSRSELNCLLIGAKKIDPEVASKLSQAVGASPEFWMSRQEEYDSSILRCVDSMEEGGLREILKALPIKHMKANGWLPESSDINSGLLAFLGVRNLSQWQEKYEKRQRVVAFRQSETFEAEPISTLVWLRQAERIAESVNCKPWNKEAFKAALCEIRKMTLSRKPGSFFPKLVDYCAECGVAVVFAKAPKGCKASGATFFLNKTKAVIVLSFRHLSEDHFWFSFFHEAGHLILHDQNALFLEDGSEVTSKEELEADRFASKIIVPEEYQDEMNSLPGRAKPVIRFAVRLGISPGVVVGQLQHLGVIGYNQLNKLKRRFSWEELSVSL